MIEDAIFARFDDFRKQADQLFDVDRLEKTGFEYPNISLSFNKGGNSYAIFSLQLNMGREGNDWRAYTRLLRWMLIMEINRYGNKKPYIALKVSLLAEKAPMNEDSVRSKIHEEQILFKNPRFYLGVVEDVERFLPDLSRLFAHLLSNIESFANVAAAREFHRFLLDGREVPPENTVKE